MSEHNGQEKASGTGQARLDTASFAAQYRESYAALRIVAAAQAGPSEADDVLQQAAIIAMERLDRFEPGTDFRAWMSAIVRGVARNHRRSGSRRDRRHRALRDRTPNPARSDHQDPITPDPRVLCGGNELKVQFPEGFESRLRNAVEALGPLPAACLLLRTVHGHSYEEISGMLDVPAATARSHVFRARVRLLEMMTPGADEDA